MTQEEKAKRYDEALERARALNSEKDVDVKAGTTTCEYIFPELKESEEEKTRKRIISLVNAHGQGMYKDDMLAWLENIPYTIDHEKREGFYLGYKAGLEKQGESSNKIHYWTEEEIEPIISDYLRGAEHYGGMIGRLRCLKPKPLTVDIDSMVEAYEQRLLSQGSAVRNSPIVNMCVAAFKHGVENTLDELHLKQGGQKPLKVYRVENEAEEKGLWRKFDGTWQPLFDMLTDGKCKDMPMEDNPICREGGKRWFASAPSKKALQEWFSKRDLEELVSKGFTITEFEVAEYKKVSDFEYIFTRDNIISKCYLKVSDIYPWSEEDASHLKEAVKKKTINFKNDYEINRI